MKTCYLNTIFLSAQRIIQILFSVSSQLSPFFINSIASRAFATLNSL